MSKNQQTQPFSLGRVVRKFFVSAFVVFTFVAYTLHQRFLNPDAQSAVVAPPVMPTTASQLSLAPSIPAPQKAASIRQAPAIPTPAAIPTVVPTTSRPSLPTAAPQLALSPTATPQGLYKDGSYTGEQVDAFYGLVQVQAIIRSGKIANVQFLQFPNDRRTSQRINTVAVPYLQTEAIQAQSANVDIVSGATLTSEAFAQSLQSALDVARN